MLLANLQKLLQRGQERDQFLADMRKTEEPDRVLELRQTIQIMQEKLDEREGKSSKLSLILSLCTCGPDTECCFVRTKAELSRRNSEDNVENIPLPKKTVVILKKELAQKTEALNKALKRENELKVSWLHLLLSS